MLDSYRLILAVPGGWSFSAAGLVARLPISMMGLGIVLLVEAVTDSYGLAGTVSAAYVAAGAVFSVVQGRLLDRLGQARVLVPLGPAFTAATAMLVFSVRSAWPAWAAYVLAAVGGATLPSAGACVRARWSHVLRGRPRELQTAFALEAVVDEAVFILGPILVTVLATAVHPVAGLGTAVAAGLAGTLLLAAQRGTEPPVDRSSGSTGGGTRLPWRTLAPVLVVSLGLGATFGAMEVVTVAFAEARGHQAWAGPLLAGSALGSLLAGVVTGAVSWRSSPTTRVRVGALGMFGAMLPLPFIGSLPVMGVALLVGGFAIAPTLIAATTLVEQAVPRSRLTEGMALLHTAVVAGIAPGAAVAGWVVDHSGSSPAYGVAVVAGALAALAGLTLPRGRGTVRAPQ